MEVNLVHHACTVTSKTINNYQTKLWKTKLLYTVVQVKEKKHTVNYICLISNKEVLIK